MRITIARDSSRDATFRYRTWSASSASDSLARPGNRQVGDVRRAGGRGSREGGETAIRGFVRTSHARPSEEKAIASAPRLAASMSLGHGIVLSTTASDIISGTAPSSGVDRSRPRTADRSRHCVARACTRTYTRAHARRDRSRASERASAYSPSFRCAGERARRGWGRGRQARNTFTETPEIITAKQSRLVGKLNWLRVPARTGSLLASGIGGSRLGRSRIRPRDDRCKFLSPPRACRSAGVCKQTRHPRRVDSPRGFTSRFVARRATFRNATRLRRDAASRPTCP